ELPLLHRYEARLHLMYQRALHNILLLRTVGTPNQPSPPVGPPERPVTGAVDLPTPPSPTESPSNPAGAPPNPTVPGLSTQTGPSAQWDRPSSSVVCQPASSLPEQEP